MRDAVADPALLYGAYAPYAYGVPFGSSTGLDPITQGLDASTQGYAPYAYGYGLGYYGKRDADADADPALLYGAYAPYGYGLGYYGKRDADADPALFYGGYAGYPYAYGLGLTHPSNVGLCLNYVGAQVPC